MGIKIHFHTGAQEGEHGILDNVAAEGGLKQHFDEAGQGKCKENGRDNGNPGNLLLCSAGSAELLLAELIVVDIVAEVYSVKVRLVVPPGAFVRAALGAGAGALVDVGPAHGTGKSLVGFHAGAPFAVGEITILYG
jgi:hypothetical protein